MSGTHLKTSPSPCRMPEVEPAFVIGTPCALEIGSVSNSPSLSHATSESTESTCDPTEFEQSTTRDSEPPVVRTRFRTASGSTITGIPLSQKWVGQVDEPAFLHTSIDSIPQAAPIRCPPGLQTESNVGILVSDEAAVADGTNSTSRASLQLPAGSIFARPRTESKVGAATGRSCRPVAFSWCANTPDSMFFPDSFGMSPTSRARVRTESGKNWGQAGSAAFSVSTEAANSEANATSDQAPAISFATTSFPFASIAETPMANAPQPIQLMPYLGEHQTLPDFSQCLPPGMFLPPLPMPQFTQEHLAYMAQQMAVAPLHMTAPVTPPQRECATMPLSSRTTVVLQNLPNGFTRGLLLKLLDDVGFRGKYDFAYLPIAFDTMSGLSHGFVNLISPADAEALKERLTGFQNWPITCDKVCAVSWNDKQQGLEALIERYRNSPVMHESVPDECKPLIIVDGRPIHFPRPTQKLKAPKNLKRLCTAQ